VEPIATKEGSAASPAVSHEARGSAPESLRAVLRPAVGRDELDDAMHAGGWRLVNVIDAMPGRPSQLIFAADRGAAYVHVIDELQLGVTYLSVSCSPGADTTASEVLAALREALPCHPPDAHEELLADLDGGSVEALRLGLALLVLQAPEAPDGEDVLRRALSHRAMPVRAAALCACAYAARPSLLPALLAMQTGDDDPELRRAASQVIDAFYGGAP
jgi:hypothetical protein